MSMWALNKTGFLLGRREIAGYSINDVSLIIILIFLKGKVKLGEVKVTHLKRGGTVVN